MSLISDLVSGGLSGILNPIASIFIKKDDTKLEMYKVDGKVDQSLIEAHTILGKAKIELLKNQWIVGLQVGFGVPLMIYYGKIILYDKVFGLGHTDPLTGEIATYSQWIVAFLFAHSILDRWSRKT